MAKKKSTKKKASTSSSQRKVTKKTASKKASASKSVPGKRNATKSEATKGGNSAKKKSKKKTSSAKKNVNGKTISSSKKKTLVKPVPHSKLKKQHLYDCLKLDEGEIKELETEVKRVKRLIKNYRGRLLDRKGVQGIGVGLRETRTSKSGKTIGLTNEVVIQVFVEKKHDEKDLPEWKKLPSELGRSKIPVDVIEIGEIHRTSTVAQGGMGIQRTDQAEGRGTLGAIVFRGSQAYGMTNAHVAFTDPVKSIEEGEVASMDLVVGDDRVKLGTCDASKDAAYGGTVDVALVKFDEGIDYSVIIEGVTQNSEGEPDSLAGSFPPKLGTRILKRGFKSDDVQKGTVTSVNGEFSFGNVTFSDQIVITGDGYLQPKGDSGSVAVYDNDRRMCVGLMHGGSETGRGIASKFSEIGDEIPDRFRFFKLP